MEHHFSDRDGWRKWLAENHSSYDELSMIIYKKHTGKKCVAYNDAVEEALCFGWIDGKIKRVNEDYYTIRFTPRNPKSRWSATNLNRVNKMIAENRMTPAGLLAFNEYVKKPDLGYDNRSSGETKIPEDLNEALNNNETALNHFIGFPPSAKRIYIGWLNSAKRPETRKTRIIKIVKASELNKKPGMTI